MIDNQQGRNHGQSVDELPELAAGVLGGRERVDLLEHVGACARCAGELDRLMATVDSLLHLATEVDPPVGFEVRVIEQLHARSTSPRSHDRLRRVLARCDRGFRRIQMWLHKGRKGPPQVGIHSSGTLRSGSHRSSARDLRAVAP
jgi:hypothetical protein